jgi:pimeloyl-ACP methyl ester carboxylesterase
MNFRQIPPASMSRLAIITPHFMLAPAPSTTPSADSSPIAQDVIDNQELLAKGKLPMPVLAIGGDHSYGARLATEIAFAAANVRGAVISDSGHWIMEEQPEQAIVLILSFVDSK